MNKGLIILNKREIKKQIYQLEFKKNIYEVKFIIFSEIIDIEYIKYICPINDKKNIKTRTLNKIENIEYNQIKDLLKEIIFREVQ